MTFHPMLGDTGVVRFPEMEVAVDFANAPTSAVQTWTDVTDYVRGWNFKRGTDHELGRAPAADLTVLLDNRDGDWDPDNASGAFYPNVKPMRRIRIKLRWAGVEYTQYLGVIQGYPLSFPASGFDAVVQIRAYDLMSVLPLATLETALATMTTAFGSDNDLTFTGRGSGADGNSVSISYRVPHGYASYHARAYINSELHSGSPETRWIVVILATDDADGTVVSDAQDVMTAIRSNPSTDALVTMEFVEGVHGHGAIPAMSRTYLTGGEYAEELSSVRIQNVLDDIGVPSSFYSLETGLQLVNGISFTKTDRGAALSHVHDCAEAEDGRIYCNRSGIITFENKFHRISEAASGVTLGDGVGEVPFREPEFTHDVSEVWNVIAIQPGDGEVEEVTDATSVADYYPRRYDRTLIISSQVEAESRAQYYLYLYKDPRRRTPGVEVLGMNDPSRWDDILVRDISDKVTHIARPDWGTISEELHIEAIAMQADQHGLKVFWQLSPADASTYWILGTGELGDTSGTTTTRLAW